VAAVFERIARWREDMVGKPTPDIQTLMQTPPNHSEIDPVFQIMPCWWPPAMFFDPSLHGQASLR